MGKFFFKTVKIKDKYKVTATGRVVDRAYSGYTYVLNKATVHYNVYVKVDGVDGLLTLGVCENLGYIFKYKLHLYEHWLKVNRDSIVLPVSVGDQITICYNGKKPKKCNIVEGR